MRLICRDFTIYTTAGAVAAVLNGEFEARERKGEQPGWYALHEVMPDNTVSDEVTANIHISADGSAT